jgi:hypothetical protein
MNKVRLILLFLLFTTGFGFISEQAEAQRKKTVVRTRRGTTVVVRRPQRTVVVRKAHVRYAGLPRWGSAVRVVPTGATVIKYRRTPYHYYNGVYYTRRGADYVVVRPARGLRVRVLPVGYRTVLVGPATYYYYYGTFYTKVDKSEEYNVVEPPEGAVVDALPEGYEVETIDGKEYYVFDGVYFAEVDAEEFEDKIGYEVVVP